MSTPETIVDNTVDDTDLDAFNDLFHGKTKEEAPKDDDPDDKVDDDVDAPIEQEETQTDEDDADLANDDDKEEAPKPKPKSRAEKRIEQLLEAERLAKEEVANLKALLEKQKEEAPKPTPAKSNDDKAPHPDDKNEDGTDKYPLGMFDEAYQDDRFNYMKEKFIADQREALEREAQEAEVQRAQEALTSAWNEKLDPARERYPDFNEKGEDLLSTFADLDPAYGEYLTATIMGMEYGPDVLYFLSDNIDEAERIVKLGPQGATIALGRIEARFALANDNDEEKPKPRPKVSKAPTPPPRNKGSNAAIPEVADDTDDLDAFSAKLFKKG